MLTTLKKLWAMLTGNPSNPIEKMVEWEVIPFDYRIDWFTPFSGDGSSSVEPRPLRRRLCQ